jgi:hypothetical protein
MNADSISERVLRAWEQGSGRSPAERIALAVEFLSPPGGATLATALFAADAELLTLRISLFGQRLDAVVRCPECETEFDLPLDLSELTTATPVAAAVSVDVDGFAVMVRPPTRQDLLELSPRLAPEAFAAGLFLRCVEQATYLGNPVEPTVLPPAIRAAAASALSQLGMESPSADLNCGVCGHAWRSPLDIAGVLLHDIDSWAPRQLDEVHRIASAYHWSERDILTLSLKRRQFYLKAIG